MEESNDPAAPRLAGWVLSCRGDILMDRVTKFLRPLAAIEERRGHASIWEKILELIEEIDLSSDDPMSGCISSRDGLVKLTNKILQCVAELSSCEEHGLMKKRLLEILQETMQELYPELSVVTVKNRGIVIVDSDLVSKFVPDAEGIRSRRDEIFQLQVYTNIDIERCFAKWQEETSKQQQVCTNIDIKHCFAELQEEINKAKKGNRHSHSPNHVIKIGNDDDDGVLKVDKRKTKRLSTFLKFCWNRVFRSHSTSENRLAIWAALYGVQWVQLSILGNPLDKLSQSTSKEESLLSMGRACFVTVWTAIFFLNFIYMAMLTLPSPFRIPAYSMLGLSLLYYILAIIVAMSGYSVSLGSAQMSGLLFVFGGATGLMILLGFIIMGVLYATWSSFESSPN